MSELPSTERLLGEFLRDEPHTLEGQWATIERYMDYVRRHELGDCHVYDYSVRTPKGSKKYPLLVVQSVFGAPLPDESRETMIQLGHCDTVEPHPEQLKKDPMVIENRPLGAESKRWGRGRGTLDMWGGNVAMLKALEILKNSGRSRFAIATVLTSREEEGSEVLHQALEAGHIPHANFGATCEILVGDDGITQPVYIARTGRYGINCIFKGDAPHSGCVDRRPEMLEGSAARFMGRGVDEVLDPERGFKIPNSFPGDTEGILPKFSRAIPGKVSGDPRGLSMASEILVKFDIFPSDPHLSPELVLLQFRDYLSKINPPDSFELSLEERSMGVPFIESWMTPKEHWLARMGHQFAEEIQKKKVPLVAASGVAEEGMIANRLGTKFVGMPPVGVDAHWWKEGVEFGSIDNCAEWLAKLARYEGNID